MPWTQDIRKGDDEVSWGRWKDSGALLGGPLIIGAAMLQDLILPGPVRSSSKATSPNRFANPARFLTGHLASSMSDSTM